MDHKEPSHYDLPEIYEGDLLHFLILDRKWWSIDAAGKSHSV